MGSRRKARVLALQVMYQFDAGRGPTEEGLRSFWESQDVTAGDIREFADSLVAGVAEHRERIDRLIVEYSSHWAPDRMAVLDRNILRIALFELLYLKDIPPKVTINEFVDVAKRFSTEDSGAFVNGILDRIYHDLVDPSGGGKEEA
jgi:N utilization substance protein B